MFLVGTARSLRPTPRQWLRQAQGKSVVLSGTACTSSKACRTARQLPAPSASCLLRNQNPGQESATLSHMAESAHSKIPRTSIWTGRTWPAETKTHFCSIAGQLFVSRVKTVCASISGRQRLMVPASVPSWSTCTEEDSPAAARTIFSRTKARALLATTMLSP